MYLEDENILEFQELYKKRFNKDISHKDAFTSLTKLVNLMRLIDKPITKVGFERLQERRRGLGIEPK